MGKCQSLNSISCNKKISLKSLDYKNSNDSCSNSGGRLSRTKQRSYSFMEQTNLRLRSDSFNQMKLHLEFTISNVKCKGLCSLSNAYLVKVIFPGQIQKAQLGLGESPIFNIKQAVAMDVEYNQLESNYMEIVVFTLKKKLEGDTNAFAKINGDDLLSKAVVYSSVRFDFITLIFGPMIYDVSLQSSIDNHQVNGRITFNIVAKQFNQVGISFSDVKFNVFNKNIKITSPSMKTSIRFYDKTDQSNYITLQSKINEKDHKELRTGATITLEHLLDFEYFLESIPMICLYNSEKSRNDPLKNKYSLVAFSPIILKNEVKQLIKNKNNQVNIFFNKLLENVSASSIIETLPYNFAHELSKEISSKLTSNGEIIGEVTLRLSLKNIPLISQIPCGIFTENGLVTNSYAIYKYFPCSKQSFASYSYIKKQLHSVKENLCNKITKQKGEIEAKILKSFSLSLEFNEIKYLLEQSIDDNILFYQYENFNDIFDAEEIFLIIGNQIVSILDQLEIEETLSGLDIMRLVSERGEFEQTVIAEAWFIPSNSVSTTEFALKENNCKDCNEIKQSSFSKGYSITPEVFSRNLLIKFLDYIRNSLLYFLSSNKPNQSKNYLLACCANIFFKFPLFREKMSQTLTSGITITPSHAKDIPNDQELMDSFPEGKILYWDKFFNCRLKESLMSLAHLKEYKESLKNIRLIAEEIEKLILSDITFSQIALRGEFFYNLIKTIIDLASLKLSKKSKEVHWLSISSFPSILIAIGHELYYKEVTSYPSTLNDILTTFVHEPLILNSFTRIIISKTNAYDTQSVYLVMTMIDSFFNAHQNLFNSPLHFDYEILTKIFKVIYDIDNCLTLSMLLWLYYKNSHLMAIWHVIEITLTFILPNFNKFFFHWSWKVRKMFYGLLLYILLYRMNDIIPYNNIEDDQSLNIADRQKKKFGDLFNEKMQMIKKLQDAVTKERLDPNTQMQLNSVQYKDALKDVPLNSLGILSLCIKEFSSEENDFIEWKKRRSARDTLKYPLITISPPKDDVDM